MVTMTYPLVEWMREQMREREWLEADLARAMNSHSGMISRWMQGVTPSPHNCRRIAAVFGVDPAFVINLATGGAGPVDPVKEELKAMIDATDLSPDERAESLRTLLRSWATKDRRSGSGLRSV